MARGLVAVSLAVAARVSLALQPPPGPLSAAWVAEAKDGLVQMLREHRPMDRQGSSVFSLLAANAPDFPEDPDWWRRRFVLRTSGGLGDALGSRGEALDPVGLVEVDAKAAGGAVAVTVPLASGVKLRVLGSVDHRRLAGGDASGFLNVKFHGCDLGTSATVGGAAAVADCEAALGADLPTADAPWAATLRPLFADGDVVLLREDRTPRGRDPLAVVLSSPPADANEERAAPTRGKPVAFLKPRRTRRNAVTLAALSERARDASRSWPCPSGGGERPAEAPWLLPGKLALLGSDGESDDDDDLRAARVFRVDFQKATVPADGLNDGGSLLSLLDDVIRHFESEDRAPVALAPGPASPLVGACLLALLAPRLQTPDVLAAVDALTQRQQSFARAFASAARCRDREASGVAADLRRPFPEESF